MEMWFSEFHTPDVKHSIRVNRQLYSKQSDYQRIDIFETPEFGRVLTLDGNVMLTERDEFIYDEMITHVPMSVHRSAKDILVIGAGDGGVVRELTRYDRVERIDLVEMDRRSSKPAALTCPATPAVWMTAACISITKTHSSSSASVRMNMTLSLWTPPIRSARRRGFSPANFTATAITPCAMTALW